MRQLSNTPTATLRVSICAIIVAASAVFALDGSSAEAPGPSLFVASSGSGGACTRAAPCASFGRAYALARPGQVVEVAGGNYPQQVLSAASKPSVADVVFRPAPGATVTIGCDTISTVGGGNVGGATCIDVFASHVTFDGGSRKAFKTETYNVKGFSYQGRIDTERGSTDVNFLNMDVGSFALGSSNSKVANSDIGPSVDPLNILVVEEADNAVFEHNLIHDFVIQNGGHFECMYWAGADGVVLRGNEFRSCAVFGLHAKEGTHHNELVENNVFWNPRGLTTNADLQFTTTAEPCSDVVVRYNTFTDGLIDECSPTSVYGNLFRNVQNDKGNGWRFNISKARDTNFVNAAAGNFQLARGSAAINSGDPANFPRRDKLGRLRPMGARPDAGAVEFVPVTQAKPKPKPKKR